MELWDLLDENGNNTGKTHERSENLPKGMYHLGVDIWIMNSDDELLIQKRSLQKMVNPGLWAMTCGSVLAGETSKEAAKRETMEELGIEVEESKLEFINRFKTNIAFIDTYILKQDIKIEKINIQVEELTEVKWATYEEIESLYRNGEFVKNRWDNVKKKLKN